jgi:hypothetical protein
MLFVIVLRALIQRGARKGLTSWRVVVGVVNGHVRRPRAWFIDAGSTRLWTGIL